MNIYDYAMQIEKEGEDFYAELAKSASDEGVAGIFNELSGQERMHRELFKKMKEDQDASIAETPFLDNVKSIFADFRKNKDKVNPEISQTDLYRKALDTERKSIDFYMEKAQEVDDIGKKEIFEKIVNEERNHFKIVENIIEFMTKPETWVEDAEFSRIEDEY